MPPNPADSVLADRIAARVAERGVGGLVWALARGDDVTAHALGWRDPVGETTPMTVDTLFRVASVTKPIVGALAMRLWESGVIGPDEPISTWLPELADVRVLRDADGPWDGPTGRCAARSRCATCSSCAPDGGWPSGRTRVRTCCGCGTSASGRA